jgi:hypothetical protein
VPQAAAAPPCTRDDAAACADACLRHEAGACTTLGTVVEAGDGVPQDLARAVQLYRRACDGGDARGCGHLGVLEHEGRGVDPDERRAIEHLGPACDARDVPACRALAEALERKLGSRSPRTVEIEARVCELEPPKRCLSAASAYERGEGVPADPTRAAALYGRGCDAGDGDSCNNATFLLPRATADDDVKRTSLQRRACELGSAAGCMNFAQDLADGRGVTRDEAAAVALDRKWCEVDPAAHRSACVAWGSLLARGNGVAKDVTHAFALLRAACDADATRCETAASAFAGVDDAKARAFRVDACLRGRVETTCNDLYREKLQKDPRPARVAWEHGLQMACTVQALALSCLDFSVVLEKGGVIFPKSARDAAEARTRACAMWHDQLQDAANAARFEAACKPP